jgi:hypothetical protein
MIDFLRFYNLEKYLLCDVGIRFRDTGQITPVDFFMIVIWKSNRAKTRVRDNLKKRAGGNFSDAVGRISSAIFSAKTPKERLRVLMCDWGLRLPMSSAILTILYPDEFKVYDYRVCEALNFPYKDMSFSDDCWSEYERYKSEVSSNTPSSLTLRDRDRWLWGKSFWEGVVADAQ